MAALLLVAWIDDLNRLCFVRCIFWFWNIVYIEEQCVSGKTWNTFVIKNGSKGVAHNSFSSVDFRSQKEIEEKGFICMHR